MSVEVEASSELKEKNISHFGSKELDTFTRKTPRNISRKSILFITQKNISTTGFEKEVR